MSSLPPRLCPEDVSDLLERANAEASAAQVELVHAESIARAAGLTVESSVVDTYYNNCNAFAAASPAATAAAAAAAANDNADLRREAALAIHARKKFNPLRGTLSAFPLVLSTSGGYCNTDHVIHINPDGTVNKLAEYKRRMKSRLRQTQTEERGSDRWDLPRIPGGRRRRIKRDAIAPSAPPEPPTAGYVILVSQMTTKLRHDNPDRHHNQISAVKRISAMWNRLSKSDKQHYVDLARDAREEYEDRLMEYRATGNWSPYTVIDRLVHNKNGVDASTARDRTTGSNGPWVRIPYEKKNELEREIETYEQVIFAPRPKGLEELHKRKMKESYEKRRKMIREQGLKGY